MKSFPPKAPSESRILGFDFTKDLAAAGATLVGPSTFTIANAPGRSDPNLGTMMVGSAQINGNVVSRICAGGIPQSSYTVEASCRASNGEIITIGATLNIVASWQQQ